MVSRELCFETLAANTCIFNVEEVVELFRWRGNRQSLYLRITSVVLAKVSMYTVISRVELTTDRFVSQTNFHNIPSGWVWKTFFWGGGRARPILKCEISAITS